MEIWQAIILGFVQGATEFIPISSSGHLILVRSFFGPSTSLDLAFDAVLQLATAFAILVFFWRDILKLLRTLGDLLNDKVVKDEDHNLLYALLYGTIPAVVLGLVLEGAMESIFRNVFLVGLMLLSGSVLMFYAEKVFSGKSTLSPQKGFSLGLFQSLALIPGVSRSGATISGGMILGLTREAATRFSFLLAFPIIFGSGVKKLFDIIMEQSLVGLWAPLFFGSLVAFSVGLFAIRFLLNFLKTRTLMPFIVYRVILALLIFIFV